MSNTHLTTHSFARRFLSFTLIACCWFNLVIPAFGVPHTRSVVNEEARVFATEKPASTSLMTNANPERAAVSRKAMNALPVTFEAGIESSLANAKTPSSDRASFVARTNSYTLSILPTEATFRFRTAERAEAADVKRGASTAPPTTQNETEGSVRMFLAGANQAATLHGEQQQQAKVNYLIGDDVAAWRTNVATFARVVSRDVYPGIDMVYYSRGSDLEYDFQLAPGADPRRIKLHFDGADSLSIDQQSGDLLIKTAEGMLRQRAPVSYQEIGGTLREVASRFVVENKDVTFRLDAYDRDLPLVIDPVIHYSTYLGGNSIDEVMSISVDASGAVYIVSKTISKDFVTVGGVPNQRVSGLSVVKFTHDGNSVAYATYIGAKTTNNTAGFIEASDIAVDAAGNAYVVGTTDRNLPIVNAVQPAMGGTATSERDAFLFKLNPTGDSLIFSTFHGGTGSDSAIAVALDPTGNAYVVGRSGSSTTFPATNRLAYAGTIFNQYLTKFSADGSARTYSTFLPVTIANVAADPQGNAYVVGCTDAFPTNFATSGAFQTARVAAECGQCSTDGYLTKINAVATGVVYTTFISGSRDDIPRGVVADSTGAAYVTGITSSKIFPTRNPLQAESGGRTGNDGFVMKLAPNGASAPFSSFLGGFGNDRPKDVAIDSAGALYVAGDTDSPDFPHLDGLERVTAPGNHGFVTKYAPALNAYEFSTLLGGNTSTIAALAVDSQGGVYLGGQTTATDFPLLYHFDDKITDDPALHVQHPRVDGFLMKLGAAPAPVPPPAIAPPHSCAITSPANNSVFTAPATVTLTASAVSSRGYIKEVSFFDGATSQLLATATTAPYTATVSNLPADNHSFYAVAVTVTDELIPSAPISINVNAADGSTPGVRITAPANGTTVQPGATVSVTVESAPGTQFIALNREGSTGSKSLGFRFTQNGTFTDANVPAGRHYYLATASINNASVTSRRIFINVPQPPPTPTPTPTPTPCDPNLDFSFGDCGMARNPFTNNVNSLAVAPSGKIVTSSASNNQTTNTPYNVVSRHESDGKLDKGFGATFNRGGNVVFDTQYFTPARAVLQPDGRIIVPGDGSTSTDPSAVRLTTTGSFDLTFDGDGALPFQPVASNILPHDAYDALALPDGKSIIRTIGNSSARLIRLNADGSCDNTFGSSAGYQCKGTNFHYGNPHALARQPDGKIVALLVSSVGSTTNKSLCVTRYTANGLADTTFATASNPYGEEGGTPNPRCTDFTENMYSGGVVIQPDGKIVIAGAHDAFGYTEYGAARFNNDGTLDDGTASDTTPGDSFGTAGKFVVRVSPTNNTEDGKLVALLQQANSKLLLVGTLGGPLSGGQQGTAIARINLDGSLDDGTTGDTTPGDSFGTFGKIVTTTSGTLTASRAARQPDGKLLVAGSDRTLAIARYILDKDVPMPAGANVIVGVGGLSLTFANVTTPGTTTVTPVSPNTAPMPPTGYVAFGGVAYEITTTAQYTGDILIRFTAPSRTSPDEFAKLRILHGEGGTLVDRTVVAPDTPAHDFDSRTIHARVTSLSPFVLAEAENVPQPATLAPTADAYVVGAEANRNTNYGASTELQVKRTLNPGAGRGRRLYVKFDLTGITSVTNARLRLFARLSDQSLANVPLRIQKVSDNAAAWDEMTITWNTQPDVASPNALAADALVLDFTGRYYEYYLTSFIQSELAAGR